jgi:hypothetical protein
MKTSDRIEWLCIDGRIILKCILKKLELKSMTGFFWQCFSDY